MAKKKKGFFESFNESDYKISKFSQNNWSFQTDILSLGTPMNNFPRCPGYLFQGAQKQLNIKDYSFVNPAENFKVLIRLLGMRQ